MDVNKPVITDKGVTFEGLLSPVELDIVLKTGLNTLLRQGVLYAEDELRRAVENSDRKDSTT